MENSHISWTDHTFNPWEGCTKVSPGCAHCYAETRNKRFAGGANWGKGAPRRRTSASNWRQPLLWNAKAAPVELRDHTLYQAKRPRVFCASLADWLDDEVDVTWLVDLLELIRATPNLDWLLLTKRPQNWKARILDAMDRAGCNGNMGTKPGFDLFTWLCSWYDGRPPANVWMGTTVEDQVRADERIPLLLQIPARVRFLSCEPLLGLVRFGPGLFTDMRECSCYEVVDGGHQMGCQMYGMTPVQVREYMTGEWPTVHWVIAGGESGPGARPMHPDWARSLRDQCQAAGVAFHFKQWGEWIARSQYLCSGTDINPHALLDVGEKSSAVMRREGGIDESLGQACTCNDDDSAIYHIGKLHSGRRLDGVAHDGFPEVRP